MYIWGINTLFIGYFTRLPFLYPNLSLSCLADEILTTQSKSVLRSCLKTLLYNVYISNYSYCKNEKNYANWEKKSQLFLIYTKIYHIYHAFILIVARLLQYSAGWTCAHILWLFKLSLKSQTKKVQFWLNLHLFLHMTSRYCKQLSPHSFL